MSLAMETAVIVIVIAKIQNSFKYTDIEAISKRQSTAAKAGDE